MSPEAAGGDSDRGDRQVLVLIDDSPESMSAMHAAIALARAGRCSLKAVFVEESDLVNSAAFSFACEVGAISGALRPRASDRLDVELKRRAGQVHAALQRAVAGSGLRHELVIRRGKVVHETLALADPGDMLVVGRVGWSHRMGRAVGSVPMALARGAPGVVLIWSQRAARTRGRVSVLVEDESMLDTLLAVARERAALRGVGLTVLLSPSAAAGTGEALQRSIVAALESAGLAFDVRSLPTMRPATLLHALSESGSVELVISRRGRLLTDADGLRVIERVQLPVCVAP